MTLATTALLCPEPEPACPAGITWCDGTCLTAGGSYHTSGYDDYVTARIYKREDIDLTASVVIDRMIDDRPLVHLLLSKIVVDSAILLTPETARQFAAVLLNAADDAETIR